MKEMNEAPPPQRTWLIAVAAITAGMIGASVFYVFPYAEWKATVRSTFFLQSEKTDDAIEILQSQTLKTVFLLYFLFFLGTLPFLVSFLRPRPLWISIASLSLLLSPMLWYGGKISHVAWKFVDWSQIYPEWFAEPGAARSVSGGDGPETNTQPNPAGQPGTSSEPE